MWSYSVIHAAPAVSEETATHCSCGRVVFWDVSVHSSLPVPTSPGAVALGPTGRLCLRCRCPHTLCRWGVALPRPRVRGLSIRCPRLSPAARSPFRAGALVFFTTPVLRLDLRTCSVGISVHGNADVVRSSSSCWPCIVFPSIALVLPYPIDRDFVSQPRRWCALCWADDPGPYDHPPSLVAYSRGYGAEGSRSLRSVTTLSFLDCRSISSIRRLVFLGMGHVTVCGGRITIRFLSSVPFACGSIFLFLRCWFGRWLVV